MELENRFGQCLKQMYEQLSLKRFLFPCNWTSSIISPVSAEYRTQVQNIYGAQQFLNMRNPTTFVKKSTFLFGPSNSLVNSNSFFDGKCIHSDKIISDIETITFSSSGTILFTFYDFSLTKHMIKFNNKIHQSGFCSVASSCYADEMHQLIFIASDQRIKVFRMEDLSLVSILFCSCKQVEVSAISVCDDRLFFGYNEVVGIWYISRIMQTRVPETEIKNIEQLFSPSNIDISSIDRRRGIEADSIFFQ